MPTEDTDQKMGSNTKLVALVAVFLLILLLALVLYYQNYSSSKGSSGYSSETAASSNDGELTTYTSKTHKYSISYPKTWTKVEAATSTDSSGLEIILLNLTDKESRENGKPNIIITAGGPADFCSTIEDCKDLGNNIFATYKANGDQAAIDQVLETFKTN